MAVYSSPTLILFIIVTPASPPMAADNYVVFFYFLGSHPPTPLLSLGALDLEHMEQ